MFISTRETTPRRTRLALSVGAALAATALTMTPAHAAEIDRLTEQHLQALFSSTDASGCVTTEVSLFAERFSRRPASGPPTSTAIVHLRAEVRDACASTSTVLFGSDFVMMTLNAGLNRAALSGPIELCDESNVCRQFNLDITWTADGEAGKSKSWTHVSCGPGCKLFFRADSRDQVAEATGEISDGTTNLIPAPSLFAMTGSSTISSVTR